MTLSRLHLGLPSGFFPLGFPHQNFFFFCFSLIYILDTISIQICKADLNTLKSEQSQDGTVLYILTSD